jgi:deoxyribose-phosphate aldolase
VALDPVDRAAVARMIDHTLLKPEATARDVVELCRQAVDLDVVAVCVSPSLVGVARSELPEEGRTSVCCVAGFPSGAHQGEVKAAEAELAVDHGADEVDVVIDLGLVKAGRWDLVERELRLVRRAVPAPLGLKVIIEAAALTDDEIVAACRTAEQAGADFVKTSTGFHPTGGATARTVSLMRATVGDRLGVKASGGIRTTEAALAMIAAGANRLGTSSSAAILAGLA